MKGGVSLKNRLKQAREQSGLSQKKLAQLISVNHSLISMMESGERNPSPRTLRDIAAVCGVRLEWLRDGEPPMIEPVQDGEDVETIIDQLSKEYKLEGTKRQLIEAFLTLPVQYQDGVVAYAEALVEKIRQAEEKEAEEQEAKAETLKQSYLAEQKGKRLSDSFIGSTDTAKTSDA